MIDLPSKEFFVSKINGKYVFNIETGSCCTDPKYGCIHKDTFAYKVYAEAVTEDVKPTSLIAECSIITSFEKGSQKEKLSAKKFEITDEDIAKASAWLEQMKSELLGE